MQLGRRWSISLLLTSVLALTVFGGPVASAQGDPVSDSVCASLTVDEVKAALGSTVTAAPGYNGCSWSSDGTDGKFVYLSANWDSQPFESDPGLWPGGTSLTIAGRPAYFVSQYNYLFVQLDQGVLLVSLSTTSEGDNQAALESLATLIVSRAGTLQGPPPPPTPAPVPHEDPDLEALFPTTIGGQPLTVQSMSAAETLSSDSEGTEEMLALLAADGKTIDDVTIATASTADFSAYIYAIRIAGADASKYVTTLLASSEGTQAPGQVGGKNVTVLTSSSGVQHVYPHNDVIWVVFAQEPGLSEVLGALP